MTKKHFVSPENVAPFRTQGGKLSLQADELSELLKLSHGLTVDDGDDAEDAQQQRSRAHLASFLGMAFRDDRKSEGKHANPYVVL